MECKPVIHELKTWPKYFQEIFRGDKDFEVRKNDRDYKLGQELVLREYNPDTKEFTGRILHRSIKYILYGGQFGIEEGFCVMGLSNL